jgi:hypothetical protein
MSPGTKTLLEQVQSWPEEDQEELAEVAREIESRRSGMYRLSDEERIAVRAGMDAARRGDFASDEEMDEFYRLHHRGFFFYVPRSKIIEVEMSAEDAATLIMSAGVVQPGSDPQKIAALAGMANAARVANESPLQPVPAKVD